MMSKIKILIVEDDPNLGKILFEYLDAKNFDISLAIDGEEGLEKFLNNTWDLLLLDVMMPKKDGFSLAKDIRKVDQDIPIIFLTAKSQKDNIIKAFKLGADDYLTKPFSIEELLVRIEAILKRVPEKDMKELSDEFNLGSYTYIHNQNLLIDKDKKKFSLTTKENELLKLFCLNINNKVERNAALIKIWGDDSYYNARSMDVYIAKLRKYLKSDPNIEIKTIHGHGFKLLILD
ncbi:MAG: DNA-binding response regulator [Flammeovirgaceae bacterium]|nr:DNA-binding response regulator [Flammeovirgaceae bacterium]